MFSLHFLYADAGQTHSWLLAHTGISVFHHGYLPWQCTFTPNLPQDFFHTSCKARFKAGRSPEKESESDRETVLPLNWCESFMTGQIRSCLRSPVSPDGAEAFEAHFKAILRRVRKQGLSRHCRFRVSCCFNPSRSWNNSRSSKCEA